MAEKKFNGNYEAQVIKVDGKRKVLIHPGFRREISGLVIYQIPIKRGVKCYPSDVYSEMVMDFNLKTPKPNPEHSPLFKQIFVTLIEQDIQFELHPKTKIKPLETVVVTGHGDYFTITPKL